METKEITSLLTITVIFALVAGLVIIFQEEITKAEFISRLQTTAIPETNVVGGTTPQEIFSKNKKIKLGQGRITNSKAETIKKIKKGEVLHTVTSNVSDYYARGFLEESERRYKKSPHAGKIIFLDRTQGIRKSNPNKEYVVLSSSSQLEGRIEITGWKIFDRKNRTYYKIPNGLKVLGSSDSIQRETPIRVSKNESLIITSGRSPVGQSFRVNKCTGYRSQFKTFSPTIKTQCPRQIDEFEKDETVPFTDTQCYREIKRLSQCKILTKTPRGVSKECQKFIETKVTEQGCIAEHRNDDDFFTEEWRIFLNSKEELWASRDNIIYLTDENDLLVATLVY